LAVSACKQAGSVTFYIDSLYSDNTLRKEQLGILTRAPYKILWNISGYPNQIIHGVSLQVIAAMKNGSRDTLRHNGIFLTHREPARNRYEVHYVPEYATHRMKAPLLLSSSTDRAAIHASIHWNTQGLGFVIEVSDPLFYSNLPLQIISEMGVEILISPQADRTPFLTEDIIHIVIPLTASAFRIFHSPRQSDSLFFVEESTGISPLPVEMDKSDFKGWSVRVVVPGELLVGDIPDSCSGNIIVKTLDNTDTIRHYSWCGSRYEVNDTIYYTYYSPFEWGTIKRKSKSMIDNMVFIWIISFIAGFVFATLLILIFQLVSQRSYLRRFEQSEESLKQFEQIQKTIERKITDKNISVHDIASELSLSPGEINKLVKRNTGYSLINYITVSRIEIAKERLRSSNSSEASIAETCGFNSITDMEKKFSRLCKTTPYKYRMEQRVT
jgi:AraC-like DNA-binding protein